MANRHGAAMTCTAQTCTCKTSVILGPPVDQSFLNSMIDLSKDWTVYFTRSIAGTTMALTMLVLVLAFVREWPAKRELPTAA